MIQSIYNTKWKVGDLVSRNTNDGAYWVFRKPSPGVQDSPSGLMVLTKPLQKRSGNRLEWLEGIDPVTGSHFRQRPEKMVRAYELSTIPKPWEILERQFTCDCGSYIYEDDYLCPSCRILN